MGVSDKILLRLSLHKSRTGNGYSSGHLQLQWSYCKVSPFRAHQFPRIPHRILPLQRQLSRPLTKVSFAMTESSDIPNPLDYGPEDRCILLQELADRFALPGDYFRQLPLDLRMDLNDAAFDLSNGTVKEECGEELGEILLDISRAWDTSTSANLLGKLPILAGSLTSNNRSALGRRLVSASRRFQSMGRYGQGELQKVAEVMNRTGKVLSSSAIPEVDNEKTDQAIRVLKFGELQVELTPQKAYIGAVIGFAFGILSWQISQGIQSIPESSLEYANDNALLLAKSLRGALLALFYSSTILSAFTTAGLVVLGGTLTSQTLKG